MAYADVDDVQKRMPQFTMLATSKPSVNDVPTFIADTEAEINAVIQRRGYAVPVVEIDSPVAWQILRETSAWGTIARILEARAASIGSDTALQTADRARKLYTDRLMALADTGNTALTLVDVELINDPIDSILAHVVVLDDDGCEVAPRVTMDQIF